MNSVSFTTLRVICTSMWSTNEYKNTNEYENSTNKCTIQMKYIYYVDIAWIWSI